MSRLMTMRDPAGAAAVAEVRPRPPWHVGLVRIFERHPWIGDTLFKVLPLSYLVLIAWWASAPTAGMFGMSVHPPTMIVWEMLAILPLAISRIRPGLAAGIAAVGCLAQVLSLSGPGFSSAAVPLLVYACAKFGNRAISRSYLVLALIGALLVGGLALIGTLLVQPSGSPAPADWFPTLMVAGLLTGFCAAVVLVAWLFGDLAGRRRRETAAIAERNQLLERERDHEARLAADAERMRIAREMHDVVSHSMSVMIAQSDGGRYVIDQDPRRAGEAFETIGETGRAALSELRRMLGVLREEKRELQRRPAPGLQELPRLLDDMRAAGLRIEARVENDGGQQFDAALAQIPILPEGVGLAVYRIVQEALTNTLKHAGEHSHALVRLSLLAADQAPSGVESLQVDVLDQGLGAAAEGDGSGSGLRGMQERAALYGGTVATQAHQRGFDVVAHFPLQPQGREN